MARIVLVAVGLAAVAAGAANVIGGAKTALAGLVAAAVVGYAMLAVPAVAP